MLATSRLAGQPTVDASEGDFADIPWMPTMQSSLGSLCRAWQRTLLARVSFGRTCATVPRRRFRSRLGFHSHFPLDRKFYSRLQDENRALPCIRKGSRGDQVLIFAEYGSFLKPWLLAEIGANSPKLLGHPPDREPKASYNSL